MKLGSKELLRRLGAGEAVEAVCAAGGLSRAEFDAWWQAETRARVPGAERQSAGGGQRGGQD